MPPRLAPEGGAGWKPGVSGNHVSWDGVSVVKRHARDEDYRREHAVLSELIELPLPRCADGSRPGALRMNFIDGIGALEAVESGRAAEFLRAMGEFLRRLHAVDVRRVTGFLQGEGDVIVHGDYGPHNALLDRESPRLVGVLDWETASLGSRVLDLAWCEWQFRQRFPRHAFAIAALFDGYGETPAWERREEALRVRLAQLHSESEAREPSASCRAMVFPDPEQAAAYLAALSRFLNYPQGQAHARREVEIWCRPSKEGSVELFATAHAVAASNAGFGAFPGSAREVERPKEAIRALRGDEAAPLGMAEALALLGRGA